MKIAIVGSRGIPNNYGGFEQFAQYLSEGLVKLGVDVWVYSSHNHPYKDDTWNGVHIIRCYDPEFAIGSSGQFIYDLNCILDCRKRNFDIILQLGYTTSTIWHRLMPAKSALVTNMDGIEWQRSKYSKPLQRFIKYAERLAVKHSDALIADSEAIQDYLDGAYEANSIFIPYGADIFRHPDSSTLSEVGLEPNKYFMAIARMQPDNHVEEIIKGVIESQTNYPLLIVGNTANRHGRHLTRKYSDRRIRFMGSIFDSELLNQLRYHTACYFHGHSAGGTNPSLLEAMASSAYICAHLNPFNISVLKENALYFSNSSDIADALNRTLYSSNREKFIQNNLNQIENKYCWVDIIKAYNNCFIKIISPGSNSA